MKTSKLLFSTLMLGSALTISGYSAPDIGPGFSAPETYKPVKPSKPAVSTKPKPAEARPDPVRC